MLPKDFKPFTRWTRPTTRRACIEYALLLATGYIAFTAMLVLFWIEASS